MPASASSTPKLPPAEKPRAGRPNNRHDRDRSDKSPRGSQPTTPRAKRVPSSSSTTVAVAAAKDDDRRPRTHHGGRSSSSSTAVEPAAQRSPSGAATPRARGPTVERPKTNVAPPPRHSLYHPPSKPSRPPIVPGRPTLPSARDSDPALVAVRKLAARCKTGSEARWAALLNEAEERAQSPARNDVDPSTEDPDAHLHVPVSELVHAPEDLALLSALVRYYNRPMDIDFGAASKWRGGSTIALAQVVSSTTRNANVVSVAGALPPLAVDTLNSALSSTSRWRQRQVDARVRKQREAEIERIIEEIKVEEGERKVMFYETWRQRLKLQGLERQQRLDTIDEHETDLASIAAECAESYDDARVKTEQRLAYWRDLYSAFEAEVNATRGDSESQEDQQRKKLKLKERQAYFALVQALRERHVQQTKDLQALKSVEYEQRKALLIERRDEFRRLDDDFEEKLARYTAEERARQRRLEDEAARKRREEFAAERQRVHEEQVREHCEDAEMDRRRVVEAELHRAYEGLLRSDFESRNSAKSREQARILAEKRRAQYIKEDAALPAVHLKLDGNRCQYAQNSFGFAVRFTPIADVAVRLPETPQVLSPAEVAAKTAVLGGRITVCNYGDRERQTESVVLQLPSEVSPGDVDGGDLLKVVQDTLRSPTAPTSPRRARFGLTSPTTGPASRATTYRSTTGSPGTHTSNFGDEEDADSAAPQDPNAWIPETAAEARSKLYFDASDGCTVLCEGRIMGRVSYCRPCDADALEAVADEKDAEASLRAEVAAKSAMGAGLWTCGAVEMDPPTPANEFTDADHVSSGGDETSEPEEMGDEILTLNPTGSKPGTANDNSAADGGGSDDDVDACNDGNDAADSSSLGGGEDAGAGDAQGARSSDEQRRTKKTPTPPPAASTVATPEPAAEAQHNTAAKQDEAEVAVKNDDAADGKPKASPLLFAFEIEPDTPVVVVRAILQSLAYRNAFYTGYDVPQELHTVTLTTAVGITTRLSCEDEEAGVTQKATATSAVTLGAPLIAAPRQPQHTFLEEGSPIPIYDDFAIYGAATAPPGSSSSSSAAQQQQQAYRWATFTKVENDRAAAAGIDPAMFWLRLSIDILDPGDTILLDDRDRHLSLTDARPANASFLGVDDVGSDDEMVAYILFGAQRVAKVTGPLHAWSKYEGATLSSAELTISVPRNRDITIQMIDGPNTTTSIFSDIIHRIAFSNCTTDPMDGRRRIRLDVADAKTQRAGSIERRLRVVPVDDITEMDLKQPHAVTYRCPTEVPVHMKPFMPPEQPVYIAPKAEVWDPDSDVFIGGSFEFEVVKGGMPGDYLYCLPRSLDPDHPDFIDVVVEQLESAASDAGSGSMRSKRSNPDSPLQNQQDKPATFLRRGDFSVRLEHGHVLTGVPSSYIKRSQSESRRNRRQSVAPTGALAASMNASTGGGGGGDMPPSPSTLNRNVSSAANLEPSSTTTTDRTLVESQVKSLNARPRTPPEGRAQERRTLLRFVVERATCEFLQTVLRSIAFKATERQLGVRAIESRLIAGDPFEVKFRKFDPFVPVTAKSHVAVCEPLIHAAQKSLVYREGMGLMPLPGIGVVDETSLGYRPWAGGWMRVTVVDGYAAEEDRVGLRSYDQAVVDTAMSLTEVVPDYLRDEDFMVQIRNEQRDRPTGRRDRTEELQVAAIARHAATMKVNERSSFERHYDVMNYERTVVGRLKATFNTFSVFLRDDLERKRRKGQAQGSSSPNANTISTNAMSSSFAPGMPPGGGRGVGFKALSQSHSFTTDKRHLFPHFEEGAGIRRKDIVGLMKQIVFENRSNNPTHVNKVIIVSVNDGDPNSTTHLPLDLSIQLVDDVTEIVRANAGCIDYRHGHEDAVLVPFEDCKLVDPDSNRFNTGSVSVSMASAGQCEGDSFRFLTLEEQRQRRKSIVDKRFTPYLKPFKAPQSELENYEFIFDVAQGLVFVLLPDSSSQVAGFRFGTSSPASPTGTENGGGGGTDNFGAHSSGSGKSGAFGSKRHESKKKLKRRGGGGGGAGAEANDDASFELDCNLVRTESIVMQTRYRDVDGNPAQPMPIGFIQTDKKAGDKSLQIGVNLLQEGDLVPEISLDMAESLLRCIAFYNTTKPTKCRSGNRVFTAKVNPGGGAEDGRLKVTSLVSPSLIGLAELSHEAKPIIYRRKSGPCTPLGRFIVTQDLLLKHGFVCVEIVQGLSDGDSVKLDIGTARPFQLRSGGKSLYTSKELYCGGYQALLPKGFGPGADVSPGFLITFDNMSRISGAIVQLLLRTFSFSSTAQIQEPGTRVVQVTICDGTHNQLCRVRHQFHVEVDDDVLEFGHGKHGNAPIATLVPPPSPRPPQDENGGGKTTPPPEVTSREGSPDEGRRNSAVKPPADPIVADPVRCFPDVCLVRNADAEGRVLAAPTAIEVECSGKSDRLSFAAGSGVEYDPVADFVLVNGVAVGSLTRPKSAEEEQEERNPTPKVAAAVKDEELPRQRDGDDDDEEGVHNADGKPPLAGSSKAHFAEAIEEVADKSNDQPPKVARRTSGGAAPASNTAKPKPPSSTTPNARGRRQSVIVQPQTKQQYEQAVAGAAKRVRNLKAGALESNRLVVFLTECDMDHYEALIRGIEVAVFVDGHARCNAALHQGGGAAALPPAPPGAKPLPAAVAVRSTVKLQTLAHTQAAPLSKLSATIDAVVGPVIVLSSPPAIGSQLDVFNGATVRYPFRSLRLAWRPLPPPRAEGESDVKPTPLSLVVVARGGIARRSDDFLFDKEKIAGIVGALMPANGVVGPGINASPSKAENPQPPKKTDSKKATPAKEPLTTAEPPTPRHSPEPQHHRLLQVADAAGHRFIGYVEFDFTKKGLSTAVNQKFLRSIGAAPPPAAQTAFNVPHRFRIEAELSPDTVQVVEVDIITVADRRALEKASQHHQQRRGSMRRKSFSHQPAGGGGEEAAQPSADSEPGAA